MNKIIFTALISASIFSSHAFAIGQGAVAGSASMFLGLAGEVGHVSSSIAVGKANAYTTGDITLGTTATAAPANTSATGASDKIIIASGVLTIDPNDAADLQIVQGNILNNGTVTLDALNTSGANFNGTIAP